MRVQLLVLSCALCLLAACGECNTGKASWTELEEGALSPEQAKQRAQALGARDALFGQLSKRLMTAMQDGGPGAAIQVCRDAAPEIAAKVSEARGVTIGRTSHKLRNPKNQPPTWAADYVGAERAENLFLADGDGRMAALLPIRLQQACLACHGDASKLPDPVKTALAEHYPEDQATGFAGGDLRGWFWIEVPKAP